MTEAEIGVLIIVSAVVLGCWVIALILDKP